MTEAGRELGNEGEGQTTEKEGFHGMEEREVKEGGIGTKEG